MLVKEIENTGSKIIGVVYDEIILEVPEQRVEEIGKIIRNTMEHAGRHSLKKCR